VFWNEDHSDGAFVLEGATSPSAVTDEQGRFAFANIAPGDYVAVVGDVLGYHEIISESGGKATIFTAETGKIVNIGTLTVKSALQ
jgi:hypothetical protein